MRKIIALLLLSAPAISFAQNVGIGTTSPLSRLHVTDSNVIFSALPVFTPPASLLLPVHGTGTRLMWLPRKSAFRAGTVSGTFWDTDSVGAWSFAAGRDVKAKGAYSVAFGSLAFATGDISTAFGAETIASGNTSVAMGSSSRASGNASTALGYLTTASGIFSIAGGNTATASGNTSVAFGNNVTASGDYSTALGYQSTAGGFASTALGNQSTATNHSSMAMGYQTTSGGFASTAMGYSTSAIGSSATATGLSTRATGYYSIAAGQQTVSKAYASLSIGRFNDSIITSAESAWTNTDPVFYIGNGTADAARHNAMVVYKNGNVVLKNPIPVTTDPSVFTVPVSGAGTRMMWLPEKSAFRVGSVFNISANPQDEGTYWDADSIGVFSFAAGVNALASGNSSVALKSGHAIGSGSIAIGGNTWARGPGAISIGDFCNASGSTSLAMGYRTLASNTYSVAMGQFSESTGETSTAMGDDTKAIGNISTAMGQYTNAVGSISTATGRSTYATGELSFASGHLTVASGTESFTMGYSTHAKSYASLAIGRFNDSINSSNKINWVATDPLLILGNGTADNARSNALVVYKNGNTDINGYTQLGKASEGAPAIKTKKIIGYNTPSSANPNSWTFVPHGLTQSKILSVSVMVNVAGNYDIFPHSPDAGAVYTVNTDPTGGGAGPSIAVGVKSVVQSTNVMGRPIKILITYEE